MTETMIVVPLRYPLESEGVATLRRALDIAADHADAHLYLLHVNLIHQDEHVERSVFMEAVEAEVDRLENASFHVRNAFLLEEAILYEAVQQDADHVVIGTDTRAHWRQILTHRLGIDIDLEAFLETHLSAKLVVVD